MPKRPFGEVAPLSRHSAPLVTHRYYMLMQVIDIYQHSTFVMQMYLQTNGGINMSGQDSPVSGPVLPVDVPSPASSGGGSETGHTFELSVSELANLLATAEWSGGQTVASDGHAYDGNAALALDAVVLPQIDSALDLLTSSPDLFDIPALQLPSGGEDTSTS